VESDILRLVQAYLDAGGTAKMTCGGLRRIRGAGHRRSTLCLGSPDRTLFDTPHLYELLAAMPMITMREPAPKSSWRITESNANAISLDGPVAVAQ